jgi:hypothetical protein
MKYVLILLVFVAIEVMLRADQQYKINVTQAKSDSIQHVADSLYWELLPTQIELGRYQVAYDIFAERNPKAASEFGDIISNETE